MTLQEIDLSHLTDEERSKVLKVLERDEQLRETEQKRVRNLKDEVKTLRLKGTIREGRSATRTCARCREPFGIIFNTGSICAKCQHRVCKKCQESVSPGGKWICIFCFRQMEFEAKSGNWFYSKFPRSMRDRATNEIVSGRQIVQDAISSGSLVDGLDPEMVSACTTSSSPLLSSLFFAGRNSAVLEAHVGVCSKHVLEAYHDSSGPAESMVPCEDTIPGATAHLGASEREEDVTTVGACGWVENNDCSRCSVDLDSELSQDSIIRGVHVMPGSDFRTQFAELEQVEGNVEASGHILSSDHSLQLENFSHQEHVTLLGSEEHTGLVGFFVSTELSVDEDFEQSVSGRKRKEDGPPGLCDSNHSAFDGDEELHVFSDELESILKDLDHSDNECRDVVVPPTNLSEYSSGMPIDGSNETSMPLNFISNCSDFSVYPTSGSKSSSVPAPATDSEYLTDLTLLAIALEQSPDSKAKPVSSSELTEASDKVVLTAHPVNECTTVDDVETHHLSYMLYTCLDKNTAASHCTKDDILESSGEVILSNGTSSTSCPASKDPPTDDSIFVIHAAEERDVESEVIPLRTDPTNSLGCVVQPSQADDRQNLSFVLLGIAADLEPATSSMKFGILRDCVPVTLLEPTDCVPVTLLEPTDCVPVTLLEPMDCVPVTLLEPTDCVPVSLLEPTDCVPVTLLEPTDCVPVTLLESTNCVPVTRLEPSHVNCSNGSCEIDVAPTKTLPCSEQIPISSELNRDEMESSSSSSSSNGSAGSQDSVRSKVGALLAKYGRGVDQEKSPDCLVKEKNSLRLSESKPYGEHAHNSVSYQPSTISSPSAATVKDMDTEFHRNIYDDLGNKRDLTVLVDSAVLANNINNSNRYDSVYDENSFDIADGYDLAGKVNDCRMKSVSQEKTGHITSSSKQSWNQVSLLEEDSWMDSYGSSDGFSNDKSNNFFLDDLEWDADELDGLNRLDGFDSGDMGGYENMSFSLYPIGTSESHPTDLSDLRNMLSTCLSHSSAPSRSPPHSPSELDSDVFVSDQPSIVISNSRGLLSRYKFRRTLLSNQKSRDRDVTDAFNENDDDDNDSILSAISEHTEPDSLSD